MKGIILAGGLGTRLFPITVSISKHLLPIYDKPLIYYPLSTLMLAGIKDVVIITTNRDIYAYYNLLGDGNRFGIHLSYLIQNYPNGIPEAFILAEDFIGNDDVCLILGDNIFYGESFKDYLQEALSTNNGATIFGCYSNNPQQFGVLQFKDKQIIGIQEKPTNPPSSYIVPGLYFYDNSVIEKAKSLQPSQRGELEIADLNNIYIQEKSLKAILLGRGTTWIDTGTKDDLLRAANFIEIVQKNQNTIIACLEEIAYNNGWLNDENIKEILDSRLNTEYYKYLFNLLRK